MSRREGMILAVLCAVLALDGMDVASMGPALPQIQTDLGMSPSSLQWVVSAYVIGYGGFLLLGGRLADLFSKRGLLLSALLVFAVASAVGAVADSGGLLIAARLGKGIAAAFTAPAALAILLATYREPAARNRALGFFISAGAGGFSTGLVLGGALSNASWRLTLLVPTLLALAIAAAGRSLIPHQAGRAGPRPRVDVLGAATVTAAMLLLVFGVSHAATASWTDAVTVLSLAAAVALTAAFVWIEGVREAPLVPLQIFTRPQLAHSDLTAFLFQGAYVGFQFVATLYFQDVIGWSPLQTGLAFVISGITVIALSRRFAALVTRVGVWPVATGGLILQVLGYAWFLRLDAVDPLVLVLVSQALLGVGYAAIYPALNIGAVARVQEGEEGLGGGMFIAATQIGSGVVLAITASLFAAGADRGIGAYEAGMVGVVAVISLAAISGVVGLVLSRVRGDEVEGLVGQEAG